MHNVKVHHESNHKSFTQELAREFSPFVVAKTLAPADIKIYFYEVAQEPALAHKITHLQESGHKIQEANWSHHHITYIIDFTDFSLNIFAQAGWNLDEVLLILVGSLGSMLRFRLSQRTYVASFHAASLAWEGEGLLLVGDTGAGKTTLSYLCMQAGFGYLSDEDSLIGEKTGLGWQILAYPRRLRLGHEILECYPELLLKQFPNRPFNIFGQPGYIFDLAEPYIFSAPLRAGVILNNDKGYTDAPQINSLSKARARFWLLHSLEAVAKDELSLAETGFEGLNRQGFYVVDELLDSLEVFELRYNIYHHLFLIPHYLKKILEMASKG